MAVITDLPEELLLNIISYFEFDRPFLIALARVSRRFHFSTQKFIFRHIDIPFFSEHAEDRKSFFGDLASTDRCRLLARSLEENGELRKNVRSFGPFDLAKTVSNSCVTQETLRTIEGYPNLREISVLCSRPGKSQKEADNLRPFFDSPVVSKLSTVNLEKPRLRELITFVVLPNINELTVEDIVEPWELSPEEELPSSWKPPFTSDNSRLRKLKLISSRKLNSQSIREVMMATRLTPHDLCEVLSFCPTLEELECHGHLGVNFWGSPPPEYTFSTAGIQDALNRVRSTLKRLEIFIPPKGIMRVDGNLLDLSQFSCLERLRISGLYIFPYSHPMPSRENTYRILPRSIESVHMDFPPQVGLFHGFFNERPLFRQEPEKFNFPAERCAWILQLAEMKAEALPRLRRVTLMDDELKAWHKSPARSFQWTQPAEMRKAFAAANIDLDVRVTVWLGR